MGRGALTGESIVREASLAPLAGRGLGRGALTGESEVKK